MNGSENYEYWPDQIEGTKFQSKTEDAYNIIKNKCESFYCTIITAMSPTHKETERKCKLKIV